MENNFKVKLQAFSERLSGPLGNVPLDRAIRADLELFKALRESGATWPQIANALAAAGARRPDGSIISADHVRSAVTRQMKRTPPAEAQEVLPNPSSRQQQVPPAAAGINSEQHIPGWNKVIHTKRDGKADSGGGRTIDAPLSGLRNQSILEKLARTRKLRES